MSNEKIKHKNLHSLSMLCITAVLLFLNIMLFSTVLTGCGAGKTKGTESDGASGSSDRTGRFVESKMVLPEEIGSVIKMKQLSDQTIEVVGRDKDYSLWVAKSSDSGTTWATSQLTDIATYDIVTIADDGTIAVIDYAENGSCPVTVVEPDGSAHSFSVELSGTDGVVYAAALDTEKNLVMTDTADATYIINTEDGSKKGTLDIEDETFISFLDIIGTDCIAVTREGVYLFDSITGKEKDELTAISELIQADDSLLYQHTDSGQPVVFARGEGADSIVFACYKGIYHYTIGGSVTEELVPGAQAALGNSGSIFYGISMQDETHFLVAGSNGMEAAVYSYVYDSDAAASPDQELNIYALEDTDTLRQAVSIFRQQEPDIYVNLEVGMTDGSGVTLEDALKTLSTDILAGNGPDVLILDGMPVDSYIGKGILADISDVVEDVDSSDGLIASIVKGSTEDGKIYAIPTRFLVSILTGDEKTTVAANSLKTLADRIVALAKEQSTPYVVQEKIAEGMLQDLYLADSPNWVNEDNSLDETKISDFLAQTKRIYDVDDHSNAESYQNYSESGVLNGYRYGSFDSLDLFTGTCSVEFGTIADVADYQTMLSAISEDGASYSSLSFDGHTAYVPFLQAGVVAGGNEEAGKAFVKTLLGKEAGEGSNGIPVNEAALKVQLQTLMDPTETSLAFSRDGSDKVYTIYYRSLTNEEVDEILAQLESVDEPALVDRTVQNLVVEQGSKYLKGELSLEQAVNAIMQKMNLYLAE